MGTIRWPALWLWFACQGRVIHLLKKAKYIVGSNNPDSRSSWKEVCVCVCMYCVCVYLAAMGRNHTKVGRDSVSSFHFKQISKHHFFSVDLDLFTFPDHQSLLQGHIKDGGSTHRTRFREWTPIRKWEIWGGESALFHPHTYVGVSFGSKYMFTWGTIFLKDSMILELLASWKYEKQPVMTTTAVSTIPRYNWRERERERCNVYHSDI